MQRAGLFDLDSHEFMPTHFYPKVFGDIGRRVMEVYDTRRNFDSEPYDNDLTRPDILGDEAPIDPRTIWAVKGPGAPGAIDMARRMDVLDVMGIERQLVFPSFGFIGLLLASLQDDEFPEYFVHEPFDHRSLGLEAIDAHNAWALGLAKLSDRQRHVGIVPTWHLDRMLSEAERLAASGISGIWVPAKVPPDGTSPANERIDPFWEMFERYDIPVILHINTDRFIADMAWWDHPLFRRQRDCELPQSLYFMATSNFMVENYLASMLIGGVFDRHPKLRLGIIECGSNWLGPLVERLEVMWEAYPTSMRARDRRPTEYVAEHVRVTPFFNEPIDLYIDRYPDLVDTYCFSTDYPHVEGGKDVVAGFAERLAAFDESVSDKFFRANAQLIMPAQSG